MKDELDGKTMPGFTSMRPKIYSYLTNDNDENTIASHKKCVIKQQIKFEDYRGCSQAAHSENEIKNLQRYKPDLNSLKENHKNFIRNNRLILSSQQRFRNVKHNIFTEEVNKIALGPNGDKRIQSIKSTETYAYVTRTNLIYKSKETKCDNVIKQYKKGLT